MTHGILCSNCLGDSIKEIVLKDEKPTKKYKDLIEIGRYYEGSCKNGDNNLSYFVYKELELEEYVNKFGIHPHRDISEGNPLTNHSGNIAQLLDTTQLFIFRLEHKKNTPSLIKDNYDRYIILKIGEGGRTK